MNPDGSYKTITADFRKYPNIEKSIADHSAYLLGAKNGNKLRYAGLKGCKDYRKTAQILKDGGYATSHTYVSKLCSIIEKWKLAQYDVKTGSSTTSTKKSDVPFLVKVSITDLNIRKGAGTNYERTGKFTGVGVFTIMEVKHGQGSTAGWGRLKSGAGWISLDYAKRV